MNRDRVLMLTLGIGWALAGPAHAENVDHILLRGTFSETGTQACLVSPAGFDATLTAKGASVATFDNVLGTHIFNGDGTGTEEGSEVTVFFPPLSSVMSSTFTFNFTYEVGADRTVTAQNGPTVGHVLTGPRAGQNYSVTFGPVVGQLSLDGQSITFAGLEPTVETITFSTGEAVQRICSRSRVLIRVENDTDHDAAGQR
jgi:hypothetical protein